jgi:predicted subunit of tRNA(5-methylaminomethyl-2-thiouridylate) methyltransferase
MRKMRAYAIKQAISEIKDIEDKQTVEYIAKRHGLGYGELKQAYAKEQKYETTQ